MLNTQTDLGAVNVELSLPEIDKKSKEIYSFNRVKQLNKISLYFLWGKRLRRNRSISPGT